MVGQEPDRARRRSHFARALVVLAVVCSIIFYVFVVSAGKFDAVENWPTFMAYYDMLAEGFRAGHVHLNVQPHPFLVQQPNPYDPVNAGLWLWDITYHRGRYYLYWGPVPALLLAAVKELFAIERAVGDQVLTLAFLSTRVAAGGALIWLLLARTLPSAPLWLAGFATLVLGLSAPLPYVLARAAVYEASITGGQAFLMVGALCVFFALDRARWRRRLMFLGGVSWGLAIGCRVSLSLAIALLAIVSVAALLYRERDLRHVLGSSLALGPPLLASLVLLGFYNKARFGSFTDFGLDKQLAFFKFGFEWPYCWPNLYSYLLRKFQFLCGFPFARVNWRAGAAAFPDDFTIPPGYQIDEPTMGLLIGAPWVVLGLFWLLAVGTPRLRTRLFPDRQARSSALWSALSLSLLSTVPLAAAVGLWTSVMRYELDIMGGMALMSTLGAGVLLVLTRGAARTLLAALVLALGSYGIGLGVLFGFTGQYDLFLTHNPELFHALETLPPLCED